MKWRRKRDSNPREPFDSNGFQDRRIQPLCHSSVFYLTGFLSCYEGCRAPELNRQPRDSINPFLRLRRDPDEQNAFDDAANRRSLRHYQDAGAAVPAPDKIAEVAGHGILVMGDENAILHHRKPEDFGVGDPSSLAARAL